MLMEEKIDFELRDIQNLIIGKIYCYNNDIDEDIKAYPTLRLYLAESKQYMQYNGERTPKLIKNFILSHIKPNYKLDL